MTAADLPLRLADALAVRLAELRPALTIARRLWIPTDRADLQGLKVFISPTRRQSKAAARSLDDHTLELEIAVAQSLTGPDFETQAAEVLTTALDLAGLWMTDNEDDPGPLRQERPAACKFEALDHNPLLEPGLLARGLALSLFSLSYSAMYPN